MAEARSREFIDHSRTISGKYGEPPPTFSRSGLIIGDFTSGQISGREGRGTGKSTTPRGSRKSMLIFRREKFSVANRGEGLWRSGESETNELLMESG